MTPEFILGFIAGEGSFTTTCQVRQDAKYGVHPSMQFKLNVKERKVLEEIVEETGIGRVTKETDKTKQWAWRITNYDGLEKLSSYVERHSDCGFEESKKYQSFILWKKLLEERDELIKSKEGIKKFINKSREINDESARTVSKDIEELEAVVDSSTNYICGAESKYTDCCGNAVDNPDDTCYRHE